MARKQGLHDRSDALSNIQATLEAISVGSKQSGTDVEQLALSDHCHHFINRWAVNGEIEGIKLFLLHKALLQYMWNSTNIILL
jgi:hypothetical protein